MPHWNRGVQFSLFRGVQGAIPAWKPEIILEEMEWTGKKEIIQEDFTQEKKIVLAIWGNIVYSGRDKGTNDCVSKTDGGQTDGKNTTILYC